MVTYCIRQCRAARSVGLECKGHRRLHTRAGPIEAYHHTIPTHACAIRNLASVQRGTWLCPTCLSQTLEVMIWFFSSLKNRGHSSVHRMEKTDAKRTTSSNCVSRRPRYTVSFSLLFLTGRINRLYERTVISSSYNRLASGFAIVPMHVLTRSTHRRSSQLTTERTPINAEYQCNDDIHPRRWNRFESMI